MVSALITLLLLLAVGIGIAYFLTRVRRPGSATAQVEQSLAQLEREVTAAASVVHRVITAHKTVRDRVHAYEEEASQWGEQAREKLRAGDADAARDCVERQVRAEHAAARLRPDLDALRDSQNAADRNYELLKQQWESIRVRYTALTARKEAADAQSKLLELAEAERQTATAVSRLQEGVADAEARAAAAAQVASVGSATDPAEIDRRLAALQPPAIEKGG